MFQRIRKFLGRPYGCAPRHTLNRLRVRRRQKGAVLLVYMTVIVLAAASVLLAQLNAATQRVESKKQTALALKTAKEALIGYALTYSENHPGQPQGYLPCPDRNGDGSGDSPCSGGGRSVLGRLPWRTLGLPTLRDSAGECLWYAVSGSFKNSPKRTLTSDSDGRLVVENSSGIRSVGTTESEFAIAIVFAPGDAVGTQTRELTAGTETDCGSGNPSDAVNHSSNYLESLSGVDNANGTKSDALPGDPGAEPLPTANPSVFVKAPLTRDVSGSAVFNDEMIIITPRDTRHVYERMNRWVSEKVGRCLQSYASDALNGGRYPWPAVLDGSTLPDFDDDVGQRFGRIPDTLDDTASTGMSAAWPLDPSPDIPLTTAPSPECFNGLLGSPGEAWYWWWWDDWREMVFYAVDDEYRPGASAMAPPTLSLDSVPLDVATIVSGRKLNALLQVRSNAADKGDVSNYLEDANLPTSDEAFVNTDTTDTFNDLVCAIGACP